MAITNPQTVLLKGDFRTYEEGRVGVGQTITPGMLITQTSNGLFAPHPTSFGWTPRHVAIEKFFTGETTPSGSGGDITQTYTAGELIRYVTLRSGDVAYMLLANSVNVTPESNLSSDGAGGLKLSIGGTAAALFESTETINNSSGGYLRLRVRAT